MVDLRWCPAIREIVIGCLRMFGIVLGIVAHGWKLLHLSSALVDVEECYCMFNYVAAKLETEIIQTFQCCTSWIAATSHQCQLPIEAHPIFVGYAWLIPAM